MTPLPPSPNRYLGRHFALRGLRERPLDFIMEMAAQFGDLVYFGSLRTPLCFVNHPKLIREVLVSRSHEFIRADAVRNALRIFDGESLLVREGDQWRQQRHLLQHGFRSERLRGYAKKAVAETHEMLLDWPRDGAINVAEETAQLSLRILSDILLGIQLPAAVADSIRMILDVRAIETGKAVATGHRPMVAIHRKKNRALTHVHRLRSAYMPLGLGPHVCIGKALSTIVLTSILACILNDFGLRIPADQTAVEPTVRIVMRPSASLRLLTTRHRNSQSHPRVT